MAELCLSRQQRGISNAMSSFILPQDFVDMAKGRADDCHAIEKLYQEAGSYLSVELSDLIYSRVSHFPCIAPT